MDQLLNLYWICYNIASVFDFLTMRHLGSSSLTRDWTSTPCIGRWSLNHWTAKVLQLFFLLAFFFSPVLTILILPALRCCLSYIYSFWTPRSSITLFHPTCSLGVWLTWTAFTKLSGCLAFSLVQPTRGMERKSEGRRGRSENIYSPSSSPSFCRVTIYSLWGLGNRIIVQLLSHVWLLETPWTSGK